MKNEKNLRTRQKTERIKRRTQKGNKRDKNF